MPFVDDPNDANDNSTAGANPLAQGQAAQPQNQTQDTQDNMSAPTTTSSAQIQSQQPPTVNKKAPKASSGMFTNIQKYVEKNKPQAQRMSQAVTEDFGKKAESIRSAAQEKQQKQQAIIEANKKQLDTQYGQAEAAVNQIMGTQQEDSPYQAASAEQFQKFMQDGPQGVTQAGDINLAQERLRGEALQRLARGADTEQGRRNMLAETFNRRGDYTQGMSGLDQLITGGDKAARQQIIRGTQDRSRELLGQGQQGLAGIQQAARAANLLQGERIAGFKDDISKLGTTQTANIQSDINKLIEEERTARKNLLSGFEGTQKELEDRINLLKNIYGGTGSRSSISALLGGTTHLNWKDLAAKRGIDVSGFKDYQDFQNQAKISPEEAKLLGIDLENAFLRRVAGEGTDFGETSAAYDETKKILDAFNIQSNLEQELQKQGLSYNTLQGENDLTAGNVATEEQIQKFNALKDLMGQSDIISPESQGDYLDEKELEEILNKYKLK